MRTQIFRWQAENDKPINRERETQCKYVISYDHGTNDFKVLLWQCHDPGFLPCFTTVEKAERCIDVFRYELIWLFTKFKWRMDPITK